LAPQRVDATPKPQERVAASLVSPTMNPVNFFKKSPAFGRAPPPCLKRTSLNSVFYICGQEMSFEDIAVLCIIGVKRSSSLTAKAAWVTTLAEREEDEHLRWAKEDFELAPSLGFLVKATRANQRASSFTNALVTRTA